MVDNNEKHVSLFVLTHSVSVNGDTKCVRTHHILTIFIYTQVIKF